MALLAVAARSEARIARRAGMRNRITVVGPGLAALPDADALLGSVPALLCVGFAGGLDPRLPRGTLLLPRRICLADGRMIGTDPRWHERVWRSLPVDHRRCDDDLASVTAIVGTASDKHRVAQHTGASSVDQESGLLGVAAERHGRPFLVLRTVLDAAMDDLPAGAARLLRADGRAAPLALVASLCATPRACVRLLLAYRQAAASLAAALTAAGATIGAPP